MSSADNYDDVIRQLSAGGLEVETIEVGHIVRCRTADDRGRQKTGWYSLHDIHTNDSRMLLVGAFGNWREADPQTGRALVHKISLKGKALSPNERAAIRERVAADRRQAEKRRENEARRAAELARGAWAKCTASWAPDPAQPEDLSDTNDYLKRKGVKAFGARFRPSGNLVIPIHDGNGAIHGLQVIYADPKIKERKGRDKDYWPRGLVKQGRFFLIGTPTSVLLLVEGYATGASLHEVTGLPVAIAFDAGNLLPVAIALRRRYRQVRILICADDDFATADGSGKPNNTGVIAAGAAALAVRGEACAPVFEADPLRAAVAKIDPAAADWKAQVAELTNGRRKLTDFNDLHVAQGPPAVRAQLEAKLNALKWESVNSGATHHINGAEGAPPTFQFTFDILLRGFVLIYGTETVFDNDRRCIVSLSSLRAAAGKSLVRMWLEHPDRRTVLPDQVVFDPAGEKDPATTCNLWGGWPTVPRAGACEQILELLEFLCSAEDNPREIYEWLLKWLAYPMQNHGAKMQTAVLMHGPEGTGKNTFFGAIRTIYDHYGGIFDQVQLESQFNGFASGKLFMIGNEVVTRTERYHQQGRLKNMVTEREWQINEKNLPTRLEQNHCNFVFFSNRIDIAQLDPEDRRYCVVWTPPALSQAFYVDVTNEMRNGGVAALHDYLLNYELGDFDAHTKPPKTRSKRELIELSLDSTERFWREWTAGDLPVPCIPCRSQDLYGVYRHWAQGEGVPRAAPAYVLLGAIGKKAGVRKERAWHYKGGTSTRVRSMVVFPPGAAQPAGESEITWLTEELSKFTESAAELRNDDK